MLPVPLRGALMAGRLLEPSPAPGAAPEADLLSLPLAADTCGVLLTRGTPIPMDIGSMPVPGCDAMGIDGIPASAGRCSCSAMVTLDGQVGPTSGSGRSRLMPCNAEPTCTFIQA